MNSVEFNFSFTLFFFTFKISFLIVSKTFVSPIQGKMSTFIPHSCGVLKVEENWRRLNKFSIFPLLIFFSFICQTSVIFFSIFSLFCSCLTQYLLEIYFLPTHRLEFRVNVFINIFQVFRKIIDIYSKYKLWFNFQKILIKRGGILNTLNKSPSIKL